mmetsp:Transcript_6044/g.20025  ORF Transcript_6044/g.20025 Transcript_6044/m.20025 type:complete len:219 (+) Transcript_6044:366-1022(+)
MISLTRVQPPGRRRLIMPLANIESTLSFGTGGGTFSTMSIGVGNWTTAGSSTTLSCFSAFQPCPSTDSSKASAEPAAKSGSAKGPPLPAMCLVAVARTSRGIRSTSVTADLLFSQASPALSCSRTENHFTSPSLFFWYALFISYPNPPAALGVLRASTTFCFAVRSMPHKSETRCARHLLSSAPRPITILHCSAIERALILPPVHALANTRDGIALIR